MVKGTSRQVIVVPSPDPELFEQAIFILRHDALGRQGISDRQILRQAQQSAGGFLPQRKRHRWSALLWAALGAAGTALVWLTTALLQMAG